MSDQYALAAAQLAVAQLADDTGFDAMQKSAYSILSELTIRYMEEVGRLSHQNTELAGRTEPNAMDVVRTPGRPPLHREWERGCIGLV